MRDRSVGGTASKIEAYSLAAIALQQWQSLWSGRQPSSIVDHSDTLAISVSPILEHLASLNRAFLTERAVRPGSNVWSRTQVFAKMKQIVRNISRRQT
jgi:hypothetical protein